MLSTARGKYIRVIALMWMCGSLLTVSLFAQRSGFQGEWFSSLGRLNILVSGRDVTGTYYLGDSEGTIRGRLSRNGELLAGSWAIDSQEGRFLFRLVPNGNGFVGRWWKADDTPGGQWIGVRLDKTFLAPSCDPAEFEGIWITNYGRMELTAAGTRIQGSFRGERNNGTVRGTVEAVANKLTLSWKDQQNSGTAIFKLIRGKHSFIGEWWFSDHEYGGFWYGVRPVKIDGCISGDCDEGKGAYIWSNGDRYEGQWENGLYHGMGVLYNPQGVLKKRGIWLEGVYFGLNLSGDCRNGKGKIELANEDVYEGTFQEYVIEGTGKYLFHTGDVYEGEFRDGKPHGAGTYIWTEVGDTFTGDFSRGKIQGKGVYRFANGNVYEGLFRRGMRHGRGVMTWHTGERYEGSWRRDEITGKGVYYYPNGDVYVGQFRAGLKHGRGAYTFADGRSISGLWEEDRLKEPAPGDSAAAVDLASLPPIQENRPADHVAAVKSDDAGAYYLVYFTRQKALPASEEAATPVTEIFLTYYIIYAPKGITADTARAFLESKTGKRLPDDFEFEKTHNPEAGVKLRIRRYRNVLNNVRVHTLGGEYFYYYTGALEAVR